MGLSGAGKSNLLGFLAHRVHWEGRFVLVDLNRLASARADSRQALLLRSLGTGEGADLEAAIGKRTRPISLLLDRFDALVGEQAAAAASQ